MNKLSILLLGALGMMAATSCEEKIDPATPQHNEQEPILAAGDITSEKAGVLAANAVVKLEAYRDDALGIPVMKLVETKDLPAGAEVSYKVQLSADDTFSRSVTLDAVSGDDGLYYISAEDWNNAHITLFGKSPKVKKAYYRVPVYVDVNGSDYRYEAIDYYALTGTVEETCFDMGFVIYDNYYLLGNCTTWDLAEASKYAFKHSEADVYDDPEFTYSFSITADEIANWGGGCWIKIASQKAVETADWAYVYGSETDGDENLEGMLTDVNAGAIKLTEPGDYKMTINMEAMTYTLEILLQPEYLYTPGGANGWNQENSAWMQFNESKGYYGFFAVNGDGFKVCAAPNWDDATTYGAGDDEAALSGEFTQPGNNLKPAPGMYWMSVQYDVPTGKLTTYAFTPVTRVGLIGSFAGSAWGSDVEMTTTDGGVTYTAEVTLAAGDEYKVRFNNGWDFNLGDGGRTAVFDGANFKAAEAGTYVVTLTTQPGAPVITAKLK